MQNNLTMMVGVNGNSAIPVNSATDMTTIKLAPKTGQGRLYSNYLLEKRRISADFVTNMVDAYTTANFFN